MTTMLRQKRNRFYILCITLISITILFVCTFFFFHSRDHGIRQEAQTHIDSLFSLSGKLTHQEKQVFLVNTQALGTIMDKQLQQRPQSLPFISKEELARIQKHTLALVDQNPELAIHSHGTGEAHQHVYETDHGENEPWISEELANIDAAIEEVNASDASPSAKEALLSVLEHRRNFLMNHEKDNAESDKKFQEFLEKDPTIIGVTKNHITGEYTPVYPNMLTLSIHQYTRTDGTVGDMYVHRSSHATDPEVAKLLGSYLEALDTLPPWEVPPPPEHKDLRLTIKYADTYPNENDEEITDESLQTPEQLPEQIVEKSEETSTETDISDSYPDSIITEDEVASWQDALKEIQESKDVEMGEMRQLFEEAIGIPINRFLEMTDAEIEAEFNKYFSEAELEKRTLPSGSTGVLTEENFTSELRRQFSPNRFNQAIQTLNRYGPEEGLRRLKEVDPEVATHLERFIQRQKEE